MNVSAALSAVVSSAAAVSTRPAAPRGSDGDHGGTSRAQATAAAKPAFAAGAKVDGYA